MPGSDPAAAGRRQEAALLDIKARDRVARILAPLLRGLHRIGVTPTVITLAGLACALVGAVMFALGHPIAGSAWGGAGAILDVIDGPLARATGQDTARGAFLDTVSDRIGEIAIWVGVTLFMYPDELGVALAVASLGLAMLIPFLRARAEAAGLEGRGGLMGRAERNLLLFFGLGLSGLLDVPWEMPTLWAMVVLTGITVLQRIYRTWVQLPA